MKLKDILETWENISWESDILISIYNIHYESIKSYKLNVWCDIYKPDAQYKYLLDYDILYFGKSCNEIRFGLKGVRWYDIR